MEHEIKNASRRRFLRLGLWGAAATPFAGWLFTDAIAQDELPKLKEDNPQAKSLKYKHAATKVEAEKYKEGNKCSNCKFYTGKGDSQWGPCTIFPGKRVNAKGWCTSYVAAS